MSGRRGALPRPFGRLFQWLFPGALGTEACQDLEREFAQVRTRHRGLTPILWCLAQAARPSTWVLAWKLRRADRRRASRPARAARGGSRLPASWLDVNLGYRMLKKYPVLTSIGVLSLSVTVGGAAAFFVFSNNFIDPRLAIEEADRLVGIQLWDVASNRLEMKALHDFGVWREELESVEELGAFVRYQPNLITSDGRSEPVLGSRITSSAFGVARTAPLLGRPLIEADERPGAEDVVVLGFDVWRQVFAGDSSVLGRTVRLGPSVHTVVGVMPAGFRYPFNDDVWVPLREDPLATEPLEGPLVSVVGRLADASSIERARAELTALGQRMAAEHPGTHESLRPRIDSFARTMWGGPTLPFPAGRAALLALLVVVCANVGALVYARNATRVPEVTVRRALGASRARILLQLFVEAVILSTLGALGGVLLARWSMGMLARITASFETGGTLVLPYWWQWELGRASLFYVAGLTVLSAVVVGLLPAVKLTRQPTGKLLKLAGRGTAAPPFGRLAKLGTALQVGLSVGLLAIAAAQLPTLLGPSEPSLGSLPTDRTLTGQLEPGEIPATSAEMALANTATWAFARELAVRLAREPEVSAVTLASSFPGQSHPRRMVEVEGGAVTPGQVSLARIDERFFDAMEAPLLAGRNFDSRDVREDGAPASVAIANRSFVQRLLRDENAIGRRVRFLAPGAEPGPWLEIVGVVGDLGMSVSDPEAAQGLYLPQTYDAYPTAFAFRVAGDASAFEPRLRALAAEVGPGLRLLQVRSLRAIVDSARTAQRWAYLGILFATLAALGLSLTGVYAVTSFLVSQRTPEIGIRVALGASPEQIAITLLTRALAPAMLGIALGAVLAVGLGAVAGLGSVGVAIGVSLAMLAAVLLACIAPARRALGVRPTEAIQAGL